MKTKSRIYKSLFLCFIVFLAHSANAQKDYPNSVNFYFTGIGFPTQFSPENYYPTYSAQTGISYERKICKHIKIATAYIAYNTHSPVQGPLGVLLLPSNSFLPGPVRTGEIVWRYKCKMVDCYAMYKLKILKRHQIDLGIGISYNWGINTLVDSIFLHPPTFDFNTSDHMVAYWGITRVAQYNFFFLHNRVNVGLDVKWHQYFGWPSTMIDFGWHTGLNF